MIPNKFNGYSPDGRRLYYKGGGGGGKAVIGLVAAIAAPWAVPALSAAIGASEVVAGAIYGAASGFGSSGTFQGAVMGGALGGFGGMENAAGVGGYTNMQNNITGFFNGGNAPSAVGAPVSAAPVSEMVAGAPIQMPSTVGLDNTMPGSFNAGLTGVPTEGPLLGGTNGANTLTGAQQNALNGITIDGLTGPGQGGPLTLTGSAPAAPSGGVPEWGGMDAGPAATIVDPAAQKAYAAAGSGTPTWMSKMGDKLVDGLPGAGLRLGAQMLGSSMSKPEDMGLRSYLDDVKAREGAAQAFNMGQAEKKNAVGDTIGKVADNSDPQFYANLGFANTNNANSFSLEQRMRQLRARGGSAEEENALRNEAGVSGAAGANTAYTSGMATGRQTQAGLYAQQGGMYGQVSSPSAGLAGAYGNLAGDNARAKAAGGYAVEQAFEPVTSTTGTGATDTAKRKV